MKKTIYVNKNIHNKLESRINEIIDIALNNRYTKCIFINMKFNKENNLIFYMNIVLDADLMNEEIEASLNEENKFQVSDIINRIIQNNYRTKRSIFDGNQIIARYYRDDDPERFLCFINTSDILFDRYGEYRDIQDNEISNGSTNSSYSDCLTLEPPLTLKRTNNI